MSQMLICPSLFQGFASTSQVMKHIVERLKKKLTEMSPADDIVWEGSQKGGSEKHLIPMASPCHILARSAGTPGFCEVLWGQNVPKFVGQRKVLTCNQIPFQSLYFPGSGCKTLKKVLNLPVAQGVCMDLWLRLDMTNRVSPSTSYCMIWKKFGYNDISIYHMWVYDYKS